MEKVTPDGPPFKVLNNVFVNDCVHNVYKHMHLCVHVHVCVCVCVCVCVSVSVCMSVCLLYV